MNYFIESAIYRFHFDSFSLYHLLGDHVIFRDLFIEVRRRSHFLI